MAKRGSSKPYEHILETSAPVAYRAQACRLSDETGLPMTVFSTTDPDMPFVVMEFSRGGCFPSAPPPVSKPYRWLPLVTFLPLKYFDK